MKKIFLLSLACLPALCSIFAENATSNGELREYNRSSLATMMVYHSDDEFGKDIYEAFDSVPMPDKYNDHNFGYRIVINDSIRGVVRKKRGLIKADYGKTLTSSDIKKNAKALEDLLNDAECAKYMIAKWFNLQGNGLSDATFDVSLVQERGQYNATEMDVAIAQQSARGLAMLSDAGEDLIGNTFILVNDITYVTAEERAAAAKVALNVLGSIFDGLFGSDSGRQMAAAAGEVADSFTGFTVRTHSYLFQLDWNDSIAAIFYKNYYTSTPNEEKIGNFLLDSTSFRLKYVAHEYEFDAKSTLKGKYDRKDLVKIVCARSMDKNIAALQLQYEDFKVKTPVYDVIVDGKKTRYAAKIGLKEGISDKSKFQVVQRIVDPETNRTKYKYVATVKPVKGKIWDNRYMAASEHDEGSELTYTTFEKTSGGEILPGMLLIEGKYRKVQE